MPQPQAIAPNYREVPPTPLLAWAVECFWTSTVPAVPGEPSLYRVLPDKCMDLLFDFTASGSPRASVVGTMTRPLTVATAGPVDLLGVRFRPGGLAGFLELNAAELTDTIVDLTNFWGRWAQQAWQQLAEARPKNRVRMLSGMLHARANGRTQIDPFLQHCVLQIEAADGHLRIEDLVKKTALCARQLERKFAQQLGISPKTFARVVRFRAVATAAAHQNPPSWARLAADFGFADQAHLVREFKSFSGLSPAAHLHAADGPPQDVGFLQDGRAAIR